MTKFKESKKIASIVSDAKRIVIIQADNPDVDSLASALALESILGDLGKDVTLYCGIDLPSYVDYLEGWDRVTKEMPTAFDVSIIVDTSSDTLLEQLDKVGVRSWLASRPCIVLDHHTNKLDISIATVACIYPTVSTTELIYELCQDNSWAISQEAKEFIAFGILSDSLGLMSDSATARSIEIIAELVDSGVRLSKLDNLRRKSLKRDASLIPYKGELLQRVKFNTDQKIGYVVIPWAEIEKYSPLYNPSMLVIEDIRLATPTEVAICFKTYQDGKVTAKIRCNYGYNIANKIAEHFGGGGHPLASGFKVKDARSADQIIEETIEFTEKLINEVIRGKN
jgi:phosphoesterase RecJ-like protein